MTNLITMNAINTNVPILKNVKLRKATMDIISIYNEAAVMADAKNREVAAILAKVKVEKLYEMDGFKSVADYAETIFGIKKANAYALATAGEIYADKGASDALKAFPPSKLVEVAKVPREALEEALKAGEITSETTQKDLREYAKKVTAKPKTEVLKDYIIRIVGTRPEWFEVAVAGDDGTPEHMPLEDWEKTIAYRMRMGVVSARAPEVVKLPNSATYKNPTGDKKPVQRRLFVTECAALVVEFYTYTAPKPTMPTEGEVIHTYTVDQLRNMLAAAERAKEEQEQAIIMAEIEAAKRPKPVSDPNENGAVIPGVNDVK